MVTLATTSDAGPTGGTASEIVHKQIRGSSLLVTGRVLSVGLTSIAQIVLVRHLATHDYGAWTYALSVVILLESLSNFGFHEAITRFVPIYHQQRDYAKMFGTIVLAGSLVLLTGTLIIVAFYTWPHQLLALLHQQGPSLKSLFILIFLVPVDVLDQLLMGLFASLVNARAIFFRRYLLAPGLKFAAVLLLILLHRGVLFLAYAFVVAAAGGFLIYGVYLVRHLQRDGLLSHFRIRKIRVPAREVFSFTVPMMTSDLVAILNQAVVVLLLGYFYSMRDVAFYRVVLPAAAMNQLVTLASSLLYLPAAARLFACNDKEGLRDLYWRTTAWIAVLSFPILTATFCFARPLTIMLYGHRYADASQILAILSIGYYFDVVFGFNGLTMKALNKVGFIVGCNLGAAVTNITVNLFLIPRYGAVGAAIGTTTTFIAYAMLKQLALRSALGIRLLDRKYVTFYLLIATAFVALILIRAVALIHLFAAAVFAGVSIVAVLLMARKDLKIGEVFPEAARVPLMRRFVA